MNLGKALARSFDAFLVPDLPIRLGTENFVLIAWGAAALLCVAAFTGPSSPLPRRIGVVVGAAMSLYVLRDFLDAPGRARHVADVASVAFTVAESYFVGCALRSIRARPMRVLAPIAVPCLFAVLLARGILTESHLTGLAVASVAASVIGFARTARSTYPGAQRRQSRLAVVAVIVLVLARMAHPPTGSGYQVAALAISAIAVVAGACASSRRRTP